MQDLGFGMGGLGLNQSRSFKSVLHMNICIVHNNHNNNNCRYSSSTPHPSNYRFPRLFHCSPSNYIAGVGLELLIDDMTFLGSCSVLVVTPACSLTWLFVVGCGRGDDGTDTKAPLRIMVVGC